MHKKTDFGKKDREKNKKKKKLQLERKREVPVEVVKDEVPVFENELDAKIYRALNREETLSPLQKRNAARVDRILAQKKKEG